MLRMPLCVALWPSELSRPPAGWRPDSLARPAVIDAAVVPHYRPAVAMLSLGAVRPAEAQVPVLVREPTKRVPKAAMAPVAPGPAAAVAPPGGMARPPESLEIRGLGVRAERLASLVVPIAECATRAFTRLIAAHAAHKPAGVIADLQLDVQRLEDRPAPSPTTWSTAELAMALGTGCGPRSPSPLLP